MHLKHERIAWCAECGTQALAAVAMVVVAGQSGDDEVVGLLFFFNLFVQC